MSSREIAELTGKEHFNVVRDIRIMLDTLKLDVISFEGIYLDTLNRKQTEYLLPKDLTLTLVSALSSSKSVFNPKYRGLAHDHKNNN